MKMKKVFDGEYRGVTFEIQNFSLLRELDAWTFYIYIREQQFGEKFNEFWLTPEYDKKMRCHYRYMESGIINNIDFHGGCTYYEKCSSPDEKFRTVKIGCDYQHYGDEGVGYDEKWLESDAKTAIDSLLKIVGQVNHWCGYCGAWGIDGYVEKRPGNFRCKNCLDK